MISVFAYRYFRLLLELVLFIAVTLAAVILLSAVQAQKVAPKAAAQAALPAAQVEEPLYREYRGVRLGMAADQVRQALGAPKEESDRQDFFVLNGAESAQVFYDTQRKVMAVTVNYLGDVGSAPTPERVFGGPVEVRPDGSIYKMVRYQRAGYFVAYSRTGGDAPPLVTVIMQKLND